MGSLDPRDSQDPPGLRRWLGVRSQPQACTLEAQLRECGGDLSFSPGSRAERVPQSSCQLTPLEPSVHSWQESWESLCTLTYLGAISQAVISTANYFPGGLMGRRNLVGAGLHPVGRLETGFHTFSLAGRKCCSVATPKAELQSPALHQRTGLLLLHLPPGIVHPVQSVTSSPGALGHED